MTYVSSHDQLRALTYELFFFLFFHQGSRKYCKCDLTAVLKIVKNNGPNQGKHFWSCPNSQAASCNFFEWEDDPATATTVAPLNARTQSAGSQQTSGECFNVSKRCHVPSVLPISASLTGLHIMTSVVDLGTGRAVRAAVIILSPTLTDAFTQLRPSHTHTHAHTHTYTNTHSLPCGKPT